MARARATQERAEVEPLAQTPGALGTTHPYITALDSGFFPGSGLIPTLASIAPTTIAHGAGNTTVTCTGTGFASNARAIVNGVPQAATYVSATSVTVVLTAAQLLLAGTTTIAVQNDPHASGPVSGPKTFTVT